MRVLVVYESMFGNTRTLAEAVADGLSTAAEVDLAEVGTAPTELPDEVGMLVVGAPTHGFTLSRPGTRASARERAGELPLVSGGRGVREWLAEVRLPAGLPAAAFDTRVSRPRLPGFAGRSISRQLGRLGARMVEVPRSFWVAGTTGPPRQGEQVRARQWGERLAGALAGQPR